LKKNQLNQGDLSVLQVMFANVVAHYRTTTASLWMSPAKRIVADAG
jgi:hypothetical protein